MLKINRCTIYVVGFIVICSISIVFIKYLQHVSLRKEMHSELSQENRQAISVLMKDLYQAGVSTIRNVPADGVWYRSISFKKIIPASSPNRRSDTVSYEVIGHNLIRNQSGKNQTIAWRISNWQIRRLVTKPDIIEVSMTLTHHLRSFDVHSNFKVKLRNE